MCVSVRYGYRDMSLLAVTEVVRPLSFVSCLVRGEHTGHVVVLDPVAARRPRGRARHGPGVFRPGRGREAGLPPSPTKLVRNGLTGTELGAQNMCMHMNTVRIHAYEYCTYLCCAYLPTPTFLAPRFTKFAPLAARASWTCSWLLSRRPTPPPPEC